MPCAGATCQLVRGEHAIEEVAQEVKDILACALARARGANLDMKHRGKTGMKRDAVYSSSSSRDQSRGGHKIEVSTYVWLSTLQNSWPRGSLRLPQIDVACWSCSMVCCW